MRDTPIGLTVLYHENVLFERPGTHTTFGYIMRKLAVLRPVQYQCKPPQCNITSHLVPYQSLKFVPELENLLNYPKSPNAFRSLFLDHASNNHMSDVQVHTDGSKSTDGVGYAAILPRHTFN